MHWIQDNLGRFFIYCLWPHIYWQYVMMEGIICQVLNFKHKYSSHTNIDEIFNNSTCRNSIDFIKLYETLSMSNNPSVNVGEFVCPRAWLTWVTWRSAARPQGWSDVTRGGGCHVHRCPQWRVQAIPLQSGVMACNSNDAIYL